MDLKEYLFENRITQKEFAFSINRSLEAIHNICNCNNVPSDRIAYEIEKATKGKVKADELIQKCKRALARREKEVRF
jgi:hypothetical protein